MLKLVVKILAALTAIALLTLGLNWFRGLEGETVIGFGGWEVAQPTRQFLLLVIAVLALLWLIGALLRRGVGGFVSMFDFFRSRRQARGLQALSRTLIALAENDGPRALREAERAERLLDNPDLTRLINAQAAKLAGDERRAELYFEAMARDPDTDFLGVQGLLRQALRQNQPERALRLAERAHALRPKEPEVLDALFDLQRRKGDWEGARATIQGGVRAARLTRDVGDRRRAVLYVSEALDLEEKGDEAGALDRALAAVRLSPGLAPAAALAARLLAGKTERRAATRTLIAAWRIEPHPDLAAGFAALEPDETPAARKTRFERLFAANPDALETKLLRAEIAISAGALDDAREALGDLAETEPTARACALMAAVEQGQGASEAAVRGWLSRAAAAPRGAQWVCDSCGAVTAHWRHSCNRCDAFDSLAWKPVEGAEGLADTALFPLLTGGLPGPAAPLPEAASEPQRLHVQSPPGMAADPESDRDSHADPHTDSHDDEDGGAAPSRSDRAALAKPSGGALATLVSGLRHRPARA